MIHRYVTLPSAPRFTASLRTAGNVPLRSASLPAAAPRRRRPASQRKDRHRNPPHRRQRLATIQVFDVRTESARPAFISLASDRLKPEGGYRWMQDVLSSKEGRQEAIETALADLKALKFRYEHIRELASVWTEVARIEKKHLKKAPQKV
jgi:hypothetical protein